MGSSDDSARQPGSGRPPQGRARVIITLPYSLSNMVFIEAAPLGLCLVLGVVGGIAGGVRLLAGAEARGILIASALSGLIGAAGLFVFWRALWRRALEGHFVAINILYASFLLGVVSGPLILLPVAAFVFPIGFIKFDVGPGGGGRLAAALAGLVVLVVLGLVWVMALMNVFERELWDFARLNGLCPVCRQWRFGHIRRPGTVTCVRCGAVLEFVRADEERGPPGSGAGARVNG